MGKIIAFHGSDHKVGTTMLALSLAEKAAKQMIKDDVLFLVLDSKRNKDFFEGDVHFLDEFREKITNHIAVSESELRALKKKNNLYVLCGLKSPKSGARGRMKENDVADFLLGLKEKFAYIVVDTGNGPVSTMAAAGLKAADIKFAVTAQNEAAIFEYEEQGFGIARGEESPGNKFFDKVLINKFRAADVYRESYISKRLGLSEDDMDVVHRSKMAGDAEIMHKTLYSMWDQKFARDICKLYSFAFKGSRSSAV